MSKKIPNIITLEKENMQLKLRCAVLTKGAMCAWCPMECKNRAHEYDKSFDAEDKKENKDDKGNNVL